MKSSGSRVSTVHRAIEAKIGSQGTGNRGATHIISEYIRTPTEPQKAIIASDIARTKIFVTTKLHNLVQAYKSIAAPRGWYGHKVWETGWTLV